jgi:hypothetical protein
MKFLVLVFLRVYVLDRRPVNVMQSGKSNVSDWPQLVPDTTTLQCAQGPALFELSRPPGNQNSLLLLANTSAPSATCLMY